MISKLTAALTFLELALVLALSVRLLRQTKYEYAHRVRRPTLGDYALAAVTALVLTVLRGSFPVLSYLGCGFVLTLLLILWIDVALYGCFTFELGLGGIQDVVLSNLLVEVLKMRCARQFFQTHRAFLLLPLILPLGLLILFLSPGSPQRLTLEAALLLYFSLALGGSPNTEALPDIRSSATRNALLYDFLRPRRPVIPAHFRVRPEHLFLFGPLTPSPTQSSVHGLLCGASVVLLTFESLGSSHLAPGAAVTPFLSAICDDKHSISSAAHFCLAPLTNAAHIALYHSRHRLSTAFDGSPPSRSHLDQLVRAGYLTLYLTAARADHYGLSDILREAGFAHIIDGTVLSHHTGIERVTDAALLTAGIAEVTLRIRQHHGPFFLHVHAANAHLPHHVEDSQRFSRHDQEDDRSRFLNSIEETDTLFGQLWNALCELSQQRGMDQQRPLLVIGSDHGQSFGEQGYRSHASAVSTEQTQVPLAFHHPRLSRSVIPWSTHFQVLPSTLDLLGIAAVSGQSSSLFAAQDSPNCLLWDGQPSRSTSGCLGLLLGDRKYSLDLIRDTCIESDWRDRDGHPIDGEDRVYFEALIGLLAKYHGVLR